MRIVINIIKLPFLSIFFKMVLLELIIFSALILFYYFPSSNVNVELQTMLNRSSKDIMLSFSTLVKRKHESIINELMIIRKSLDIVKDEKNLQIIGDTCIKESTSLEAKENNLEAYLRSKYDKGYKETWEYYALIDYFLYESGENMYTNSKNRTDLELMNILIKEDYPMHFISSNKDINYIKEKGIDPYKICYLTKILKGISINDIMFQEYYKMFYIVSNDDLLFHYPIEYLHMNNLYSVTSYIKNNCKLKYKGKECFSTFLNHKDSDKNELIIEPPVITNIIKFPENKDSIEDSKNYLSIKSRTCTKLKLSSNRNHDWICSDFDLYNDLFLSFLNDNEINLDNIDLFLVKYEGNDLNLIFSTEINELVFNMNYFNDKILEKYSLNNESDTGILQLFHGFYYKIFKYFSEVTKDQELIKTLISDYNFLKGKIIDEISSFEAKVKNSDWIRTRIGDAQHSMERFSFNMTVAEDIKLNYIGLFLDYKSYKGKLIFI